MKVLLTYIGPEDAIKVDFPIMPQFDSRVLLSDSDYKKVVKIVFEQFKKASLNLNASKKEKEFAVRMYIENATVQYIDIAWDEEEDAYLPLISMSQPIPEDYDDDENDDFENEYTDFEDIDETPHHKNHPHGKKRNMFN